MSLKAILDDIHTQLAVIDPALAVAQPTSLVGGTYLNENVAPPRVVWVPIAAAPGRFEPRGLTPRAFGMARYLHVACHMWGKDDDAAETLLLEVHNAARRSLAAGARWISEDWPQRDGDVIAQYGTEVVVVFEFHIPITELGQAAVTVTQTQQTTEIDFADGQVVSGTPAP